jgi:hypothetical protein
MKDTALVRMTINELAKLKGISIEDAFDMFYESELCKMLSNRESGLFTYAPYDLALLVGV